MRSLKSFCCWRSSFRHSRLFCRLVRRPSGAATTAGAQDAPGVEAALDLARPTRRLIQQGLRNAGFDAGD